MGSDEVVDWESEEKVKKIIDNFTSGMKEGEVAAIMGRYYDLKAEYEAMKVTLDILREQILEQGKGQESIVCGEYAAFMKAVQGRVTTDWKRAYRDAVGEMSPDDARKYMTVGEPSVRLEVKKLSHAK